MTAEMFVYLIEPSIAVIMTNVTIIQKVNVSIVEWMADTHNIRVPASKGDKMKDYNEKFLKEWTHDNSICVRCGIKVSAGWGHECLFYDCKHCGLFITDDDIWELRSSR